MGGGRGKKGAGRRRKGEGREGEKGGGRGKKEGGRRGEGGGRRKEERVPTSSVWGKEASIDGGQQPDPEGRHSSEGGR